MSHSEIQIINPITYPNWNDLVLSTQHYSFFHCSSWARVLSESYGYKPLYFTIMENDRLLALIPVMEIKSILTGRRGVSLPFSDFCEPIFSEKNGFQELWPRVLDYGRKSNWKYLELRGGSKFLPASLPSSNYYGHMLDLTQGEEQTFSNLRDSTKRNTKKAERGGVKVRISNSFDSIRKFYKLNCMTRKRHGLPPQPSYFFKNIFDHIISNNHGIVVLASHDGETIAGAVFLHFGERTIYKYGASDAAYQQLRANNLLIWEAIKWYCRNGYQSLSLGRTDSTHNGLLQFKNGWGAVKETIQYHKYDIRKDIFVQEHSMDRVSHKFSRKIPSPLLNMTGYLFYRHIG